MVRFKGFPEGKTHQISIPASFFKDLMPNISDLAELKLTLYAFWRLDQMEGTFRFFRRFDIIQDKSFMQSLSPVPNEAETILDTALDSALTRGTFLMANNPQNNGTERIYFLNSPKGRAAIQAIASGKWKPFSALQEFPTEISEPPNIFRLYEENIGPLTPLIADSLTEAENSYPLTWIEEAIGLAVKNNKRSWNYALAILERWRREGKHGKKEKPEDRSDSEEARRRYVEGEYSDFVEH